MTNVFGSPKKVWLRKRLFQIGAQVLAAQGWTVERVPGAGKSSVRRITKGSTQRLVAIRTTQDQYISFPRNAEDRGWVTLSDVDAVVAVSVDDPTSPKLALVHLIEGNEMRDRFDRAYSARLAAGHSIPIGRGVWVPLYLKDAPAPPAHVGGGAGLDNPPLARVPIQLPPPGPGSGGSIGRSTMQPGAALGAKGDGRLDDGPELIDGGALGGEKPPGGEPLTISEAKRRLALSFGVDPASIRITVEA